MVKNYKEYLHMLEAKQDEVWGKRFAERMKIVDVRMGGDDGSIGTITFEIHCSSDMASNMDPASVHNGVLFTFLA